MSGVFRRWILTYVDSGRNTLLTPSMPLLVQLGPSKWLDWKGSLNWCLLVHPLIFTVIINTEGFFFFSLPLTEFSSVFRNKKDSEASETPAPTHEITIFEQPELFYFFIFFWVLVYCLLLLPQLLSNKIWSVWGVEYKGWWLDCFVYLHMNMFLQVKHKQKSRTWYLYLLSGCPQFRYCCAMTVSKYVLYYGNCVNIYIKIIRFSRCNFVHLCLAL